MDYSLYSSKATSNSLPDELPFPIEEYMNRIDKVRTEMKKKEVDILFITEPENMFYLTGMQTVGNPPIHILMIPIDNKPFMLTRALEESNINYRSILGQDQRYSYHDYEDPFKVFQEYLLSMNIESYENFGIEKDVNSYKFKIIKQLKNLCKEKQFINCSNLVGYIRLNKSANEIKYIYDASCMTYKGIKSMINGVRAGTTENKIAALGYNTIFSVGSVYAGYPIFVSSGPHGALGHATSATRRIIEGDVVFLELTGISNRYAGPIMRTVYVGKELPEWLKLVEEAVNNAVTFGMKAMKPGVKCNYVDSITRKYINDCSKILKEKYNLKMTQLARAAYSVGVNFMTDWGEGEYLSLDPKEERELEENMVFHLIPWVQIFSNDDEPIAGIGLSETVVITKEGCYSMFDEYDLPRKILCIDEKSDTKLNNFCSDNVAMVHPKVLEDQQIINSELSMAYGNDKYTNEALSQLKSLFGENSYPFIVSNGSMANVLAISSLINSTDMVICDSESHLFWDECGSLEKIAGCKVLPINTFDNKINISDIEAALEKFPNIAHRSKPRVLSITQCTEKGTVYSIEECKTLANYCKKNNMLLHMDGSRLANAQIRLGQSFKQITKECGIDVLTFGISKNGAMDAETIIFFDKVPNDFEKKIKQCGQLKSKLKYTSVQILSILKDNIFLDNALNANTKASYLANHLSIIGFHPLYNVEANMVYIKTDENMKNHILGRYNVLTNRNQDNKYIIRLVTNWSTTYSEIDDFIRYCKN